MALFSQKDPCGYGPEHPWYIQPDGLTDELKVHLRRTHAEKWGKIQVAVLAVVGTIIAGLAVRHVEYKYNEKYISISPDTVIKMQLQIDNIEDQVVKLVDQKRSDYDIQYTILKYAGDLHKHQFPQRHPNEFTIRNKNKK